MMKTASLHTLHSHIFIMHTPHIRRGCVLMIMMNDCPRLLQKKDNDRPEEKKAGGAFSLTLSPAASLSLLACTVDTLSASCLRSFCHCCLTRCALLHSCSQQHLTLLVTLAFSCTASLAWGLPAHAAAHLSCSRHSLSFRTLFHLCGQKMMCDV